MNIKQSYFDFLNANGAKEKIENVITAQIEEWKQQPYYEYEAGEDEFGDRSGRVNRIQGKTIGDMCDTYGKVLTAYSGNSEATYVNHCGLSYNSVADEISDDINDEFVSLYTTWIKQNREEIFAELGIDDYDETWDDKDMYIAVRDYYIIHNVSYLYDYLLFFSLIRQNFAKFHTQKPPFSPTQNHLTEKFFNFYLHITQLFTIVYNKFLTNLFAHKNNICIFAHRFIRKTDIFVSKSSAKLHKKYK